MQNHPPMIPPAPPEQRTFDEQLWPVNVALLVLGGFSAGLIVAQGDFDTPDWIYNAWVHLAALGIFSVVIAVAAVLLPGRQARRLQCALLISLLVHLGSFLALYHQVADIAPDERPVIALAKPEPKPDREITFVRPTPRPAAASPARSEPAAPEVAEVLQPQVAAPVERPMTPQSRPATPAPPRMRPPVAAAPSPAPRSATRNELSRPTAAESAPRRAEAPPQLTRAATPAPATKVEAIASPEGPKVQDTTPVEAKVPTSSIVRQPGETRLPNRPLGEAKVGPQPTVAAPPMRRQGETLPQAVVSAPALTRPLAKPSALPHTEITAPQALARGEAPAPSELRPTVAQGGPRTASPITGARPTMPSIAAPLTTTVSQLPLTPNQPLEPRPQIGQTPRAGASRSPVTKSIVGGAMSEAVATTAAAPQPASPSTTSAAGVGAGPSMAAAATARVSRSGAPGPTNRGAGAPGGGAPDLPVASATSALSSGPRSDTSGPGVANAPAAARPAALAARTAIASNNIASPKAIDLSGIGAGTGPPTASSPGSAAPGLAPAAGLGPAKSNLAGIGGGAPGRGSRGALAPGALGDPTGTGAAGGAGGGVARHADGAPGEALGTSLGTGGGGRLARASSGRSSQAAGAGGIDIGDIRNGTMTVNTGAGSGAGSPGITGGLALEKTAAGPARGSRTGAPGGGGGPEGAGGGPGVGGGQAAPAALAMARGGGGDASGLAGGAGSGNGPGGSGGPGSGIGASGGGNGGGSGGGGLNRTRTGGTALASIAADADADFPQSPAPGGGGGSPGLPVGIQAISSLPRGNGAGGGGTAATGSGSGASGLPSIGPGGAGMGGLGDGEIASLAGSGAGGGAAGGSGLGRAEFSDAVAGSAPGGGNLQPRRATSGGAALVAGAQADLPEIAAVGGGGTETSGGAYEIKAPGALRKLGGIAGVNTGAPLGALQADRPIEGTAGATAVNLNARQTAQDGEDGPATTGAGPGGLTLARATGTQGPLGGGHEEEIAQPSLGGGGGGDDFEEAGPQPGDITPVRRSGGSGAGQLAGVGRGGKGTGLEGDSFDGLGVSAAGGGSLSRSARRDGDTASNGRSRFLQRTTGGVLGVSGLVREAAEGFGGRGRGPGAPGEGGRPSTRSEQAVELGLDFFARHQSADGSWSLVEFPGAQESDMAEIESRTAATGMALLAFLGAGYDHYDRKHQQVVRRGLEYLLENQQVTGDLFVTSDVESNKSAWFYSHGIAAIALCEAYGMTGDEKLRVPAQKALDFIVASQEPTRHGWRYSPGIGSDTSVSGWQLMALKSGELAGLKVDPQVYRKVAQYLDKSQASPQDGSQYVYNIKAPDQKLQIHGRYPSQSMTSVGLLMRMYLGWDRNRPEMIRGAEYLKSRLPEITSEAKRDTYYWYYATQVMFHMKGDYWKAWNDRLHPLLVNSQVQRGRLAGSWHPRGEVPDRWGAKGGRLYVTAMNLLSLEVYYRHLPIYDAGKLQDAVSDKSDAGRSGSAKR